MAAVSYKFRAATNDDMEWFHKQTHYLPSANFVGIAAYSDAGIAGMVGLDHWTYSSVWVHFAFRHPRAIAPLWAELLNYLSRHGIKILIGVTPGDHVRANRVIKKLGWREMFQQKDGWKEGVPLVFSEYRIA
jgi:hypothetical protein